MSRMPFTGVLEQKKETNQKLASCEMESFMIEYG